MVSLKLTNSKEVSGCLASNVGAKKYCTASGSFPDKLKITNNKRMYFIWFILSNTFDFNVNEVQLVCKSTKRK